MRDGANGWQLCSEEATAHSMEERWKAMPKNTREGSLAKHGGPVTASGALCGQAWTVSLPTQARAHTTPRIWRGLRGTVNYSVMLGHHSRSALLHGGPNALSASKASHLCTAATAC